MYYDGHVNLIATLQELFELEEARKAREKMSEVYPHTPGEEVLLFWHDICLYGIFFVPD